MSIEQYLTPVYNPAYHQSVKFGSGGSICGYCKRACGKCPWSEIDPETDKPRFQPVEGWEAEPSSVWPDGWQVKNCPLHEPDEPRWSPPVECTLEQLQVLARKWGLN